MLILNIIVLIIIAAIVGYGVGKGKITIEHKLDKETSERMLKEQEKALEQYNQMMKDLGGGVID